MPVPLGGGAEVIALGVSLRQLATEVQVFGSSSVAWRIQIQLLEAKHARLHTEWERYGLSHKQHLFSAVEEVERLIRKVNVTIERREDACQFCPIQWDDILFRFPILGRMFFLARIAKDIEIAADAYDRILKHLKEQYESDEMYRKMCREEMKSICPTLSFHEDKQDRYVPLRTCELAIYKALEDSEETSPAVVLLHGGPGKGKSTVAREIMLSCYYGAAQRFTNVIELEYGSEVNPSAKEMELLEKLGCDTSDMSQLQTHKDVLKVMRHARFWLQNLLSKQKLLILLDDVWEPDHIQHIINLCGSTVKCLVTSQRSDLCENLNCRYKAVQIEDADEGVSKQILASHVGFPDKSVPVDLQEVAEKLLAEAQGIPLVLATIGAQIGRLGKYDLDVWEMILDSTNFSECLDTEKPGPLHGKQYLQSYWAAMRSSIERLHDKEKQLFLLMSMFKDPSAVPEPVVHYLYSTAILRQKCNGMHFLKLKTKLKNSALVFEKDKQWLSIHPLTKRVVLELMRDAVNSIFGMIEQFDNLIESGKRSEETMLVIILVWLYFDVCFGERAAVEIGRSVDTFSELERAVIGPHKQLLVLAKSSSTTWKVGLPVCAIEERLFKLVT